MSIDKLLGFFQIRFHYRWLLIIVNQKACKIYPNGFNFSQAYYENDIANFLCQASICLKFTRSNAPFLKFFFEY